MNGEGVLPYVLGRVLVAVVFTEEMPKLLLCVAGIWVFLGVFFLDIDRALVGFLDIDRALVGFLDM